MKILYIPLLFSPSSTPPSSADSSLSPAMTREFASTQEVRIKTNAKMK
jgi:hypothetical protein